MLQRAAHTGQARRRRFVSTLNRNLKSYLLAIVGAEYVLEPARARHAHLRALHQALGAGALGARRAAATSIDIAGLDYDPLARTSRSRARNVDVNYMMHLRRDRWTGLTETTALPDSTSIHLLARRHCASSPAV